jgi:hypothetical protein
MPWYEMLTMDEPMIATSKSVSQSILHAVEATL